MRTPTSIALAALLFLSSCAVPDMVNGYDTDATKHDAKVAFQKKGPTLTLDEQAKLADPTALQLLEERSTDLAKARKRVEELEAELRLRSTDLEKIKDDSKSKSHEKEQLEGLLREATDNERAATEKALSAEIARLKFEQELLRMKLGNMLRETP